MVLKVEKLGTTLLSSGKKPESLKLGFQKASQRHPYDAKYSQDAVDFDVSKN